MSDSILTSIKKVLGLTEEYDVFDVDIIMHINSVFSDLLQLGIGPVVGFEIKDVEAKWSQFLGEDNPRYNQVKSYMYLKVKMLFDPPGTSHLLTAYEKEIEKMEWRLNTQREHDTWVPPVVVVPTTLVDEVSW